MITPLLGMVYRESITTLRALAMCLVASKRQRAISLSAVLLLICHLASMNAVHAASELDHDYCERFKETVPVDERIAACNRILDDPKEPSPAIANAYLARCQLWYTKQEHGRAVADCNAAIGRYPRFAPSYSVRGNIFHAQNNLERAIEDHTKAIELDPKWAPAYLYRAMAYDLQEKYDRAIADYSKAIEEDSNLIEAHRGRAAA